MCITLLNFIVGFLHPSFRAETLACAPNQDPATCLNADQLAILPKIYEDYFEDGKFVFTGFNLGGEDVYFTDLLGETPNPLITNWLQFMVLKCVPAGLKRCERVWTLKR